MKKIWVLTYLIRGDHALRGVFFKKPSPKKIAEKAQGMISKKEAKKLIRHGALNPSHPPGEYHLKKVTSK